MVFFVVAMFLNRFYMYVSNELNVYGFFNSYAAVFVHLILFILHFFYIKIFFFILALCIPLNVKT